MYFLLKGEKSRKKKITEYFYLMEKNGKRKKKQQVNLGMKSAQENAIALMKENIEILTDMQKALDKNDFRDLTQAYTNYQNNLSKLQGIVVG